MYNDSMAKNSDVLVEWDAKEYIEYKRTSGWYVIMGVVTVALIILTIIFKQWSTLALVVVAAVALIVYVSRAPRTLHYELTPDGLNEGRNSLLFADYRSFGVLNESNHYSIVLMPKKRFSPRIMIYFPEELGEQIVDIFGERLAMEPVHLDLIDQLVRWLRI